jgi:hypothetical protein
MSCTSSWSFAKGKDELYVGYCGAIPMQGGGIGIVLVVFKNHLYPMPDQYQRGYRSSSKTVRACPDMLAMPTHRSWQFMAPEIAISWQFIAPETAGNWRFMALS